MQRKQKFLVWGGSIVMHVCARIAYGFKTSFTMSRVVIITGGLISLIITITIFFLDSINAGF